MSSYVVVLSAAFSLITVAYYVNRWYRLRDFKGPWLASFSELWLARTALSGSFHNRLMDANKKYGPLTRIQHDILLTDDPEIISHMNAARSKHKKADWYTFMRFNPFIDNIFSERDLQAHDRLRTIMAPAYTTKQNHKLEQKITRGIQSLVQYIEDRLGGPDQSCVLDFSKVAQYYTLDVITDMAFGEPFGYLAKDEDLHDYHATFAKQAPVISIINSMPSVGRFLNQDWAKKFWAPTTKDKKGVGKLMGMAEQTVKVRLDSGKQVDDMLGSFLSHGMSPRQAEAEILTQLSAGTDSNSAALRGIFLHIITNPLAYAKLKLEIDNGVASGKVSSPVTAGEATDLPYLDACVREGMRIWPPFAGLNIKKVNDEGEVIKGRFVPGGTGIAVSFWGIQRNPVFGNDVTVFRPDRWVEADKEQRARMDKVHDLIFGYGRWICLGKSMVSMEIRQTVVELLRRFDFSVTNPTRPWRTTSYVFMLIEDMEVRVTKRQDV